VLLFRKLEKCILPALQIHTAGWELDLHAQKHPSSRHFSIHSHEYEGTQTLNCTCIYKWRGKQNTGEKYAERKQEEERLTEERKIKKLREWE
jgi:hypothetical protein